MQGAQVQSLVREVGSCMLPKKKKKNQPKTLRRTSFEARYPAQCFHRHYFLWVSQNPVEMGSKNPHFTEYSVVMWLDQCHTALWNGARISNLIHSYVYPTNISELQLHVRLTAKHRRGRVNWTNRTMPSGNLQSQRGDRQRQCKQTWLLYKENGVLIWRKKRSTLKESDISVKVWKRSQGRALQAEGSVWV